MFVGSLSDDDSTSIIYGIHGPSGESSPCETTCPPPLFCGIDGQCYERTCENFYEHADVLMTGRDGSNEGNDDLECYTAEEEFPSILNPPCPYGNPPSDTCGPGYVNGPFPSAIQYRCINNETDDDDDDDDGWWSDDFVIVGNPNNNTRGNHRFGLDSSIEFVRPCPVRHKDLSAMILLVIRMCHHSLPIMRVWLIMTIVMRLSISNFPSYTRNVRQLRATLMGGIFSFEYHDSDPWNLTTPLNCTMMGRLAIQTLLLTIDGLTLYEGLTNDPRRNDDSSDAGADASSSMRISSMTALVIMMMMMWLSIGISLIAGTTNLVDW